MRKPISRIDVVIPTRNRMSKLRRCLKTIPRKAGRINVYVTVIFDGQSRESIRDCDRIDHIKWTERQKGAVYCRNMVIKNCVDLVVYATDDIEFLPNAFITAYRDMVRNFAYGDGVIGFKQEGNKFHPTGMAMVGQGWLNRYPKRELFYPGYFHFACQEIYWLAKKHNKFFQSEATVKHYHPMHFKDEMDYTHVEARIHKKKDMALIEDRTSKGLIWGD